MSRGVSRIILCVDPTSTGLMTIRIYPYYSQGAVCTTWEVSVLFPGNQYVHVRYVVNGLRVTTVYVYLTVNPSASGNACVHVRLRASSAWAHLRLYQTAHIAHLRPVASAAYT